MKEKKPYFDAYELLMMALFAFASALLNTYLPIKSFTAYLGIPGPAAGMALLGGFIFVFWVALALAIIKKKYAAVVTSLLIASFCLLIAPWYGILSPLWFSIYGVIALLSMGIFVELTGFASGVVKERFITPHKIDPIFIPVYRKIQRLLFSLLECGTINTFKQADK